VIRGTTEGKRGKTFSITFGIGPFFAVASSAGSQFVLDRVPYPYDFAVIFLTGSVLLLVNAVVARRFVIPSVGEVVEREAFGAFFVGGFRSFFASRTLVVLAAAYLLFYMALGAMNNALLNVKDVLGVQPQEMAGWCSAFRFGAKGLAGVFLGLLLARYGARSPAVATGIVPAVANLWTMVVPGYAYLIAFGLFGAGELGGLYYPHYVAAASRPERLKRNICIYQIIGTLGTLSAALLGFVADRIGRVQRTHPTGLGGHAVGHLAGRTRTCSRLRTYWLALPAKVQSGFFSGWLPMPKSLTPPAPHLL